MSDHEHARHPAEHAVTLARHRAVLCYRLLIERDASVEDELREVELYFAQRERPAFAKEEQRPVDRTGFRTHGSLEDQYWPTVDELRDLHFCAACERLGARSVVPRGPGWPIG